MTNILIKNLTKQFQIKDKTITALDDLSITIKNESFVTIVGRSGCGKTTLLKILCSLESKTKGDVVYVDKENKLPKISIVFQEPRLMPWLTIKQNLEFSLKEKSLREKMELNVSKYLNVLGLEKFKDAYPHQISGGMAQRVSLGRTLCYEPDIILMDEPFGALDPYNRKILQDEIIRIFASFKKTIIFVTHDINEAIYLGQHIIVMDNGKVINEIDIEDSYPRNLDSPYLLEIKKNIMNSIMN